MTIKQQILELEKFEGGKNIPLRRKYNQLVKGGGWKTNAAVGTIAAAGLGVLGGVPAMTAVGIGSVVGASTPAIGRAAYNQTCRARGAMSKGCAGNRHSAESFVASFTSIKDLSTLARAIRDRIEDLK